ncbi:MAG: helix-turn-helix transcriptional regulator [Desulfuromonadales bacterium]
MMENPDGDIGRILKQRREELGRTLQNAEQETRIRKIYLESLENNRFSELPGQAYVTGFIRVYAHYLGLKSSPLLVLLNDLPGSENKPAKTEPVTASKPDLGAKHSADGDRRKFFLAFVLVLLLGCFTYLSVVIFSSDEQLNERATKATGAVATSAESGRAQARLEQAPVIPEKPQTSATGQAHPGQSADPMPIRVSASPVAIAEPQNRGHRSLPAVPYDGASLRMLALAEGSLIIGVDERKTQQYKLYDGLDLTWKIKQKVHVEFAASDVARFWLNGQEIDIAGYQSFSLQPAGE